MTGVLGVALIALSSHACPYACDLVVNPAIETWITDSVTGGPRAQFARGVVQDGAYTDSLRPSKFNKVMVSRRAADQREGVYVVTVDAPGYSRWQRTVRALESDGCGIKTVNVNVRLVPAP